MNLSDTIVATSSAVAPAPRLIVRMSGPRSMALVASIAPQADPMPGRASHVSLRFSELSVPAWVYVFRTPQSYTGDDLIEFHLPGNVLLARLLIEHLTSAGARPAEAGEFTARAFLNGRMDLTAAEGVALSIHAQHADELRAARQLMAGELSRRLSPVIESLASALALVEAGIDFTEEDISFISHDELNQRVSAIRQALDDLIEGTARFECLRHQPTFVLVGRPNAGKSTLLNTLAGFERAIVSPAAGTTRDALSTDVALRGGNVTVIDVAGLEPIEMQNPVGRSIAEQMQSAALRAVEEADFVLHVIDAASNAANDDAPLALSRPSDLIVWNKSDLKPVAPILNNAIAVSAKTNANIDTLRHRMNELAFGRSTASPALALNARHVAAIESARELLQEIVDKVPAAEMVAHDLRAALDALGQVNGQVTPDDVLGKIFAGFCIGK